MFRFVFAVSLICLAQGSVLPADGERIVGGQNSTITSHPYQVSLQYNKSHFCGGSLYSSTIIMTAAHCVKAVASVALSTLQVRLGSTTWNTGGVVRGVAKMLAHPNYSATTMENDVALIKLASAVTYSSTIKNITLAAVNPANGSVGLISGWGTVASGATTLPTILQDAQVQFILRPSCSSTLYNYGSSIGTSMICAAAVGKDSCQGDSGGPLVHKLNGTLVGIVSWGSGCAEVGYPGVYSDVPVLKTWIVNNAKLL